MFQNAHDVRVSKETTWHCNCKKGEKEENCECEFICESRVCTIGSDNCPLRSHKYDPTQIKTSHQRVYKFTLAQHIYLLQDPSIVPIYAAIHYIIQKNINEWPVKHYVIFRL